MDDCLKCQTSTATPAEPGKRHLQLRAKDRADASQASKRSPIGDSPRHKRCNRSLS